MKTSFKNTIVLVLITLSFAAKSDCIPDLIAWPSTKKINVNSVFILIGKKIPRGKLFLKNGKDKIELGVLTWCNAANSLSQILFSPKNKLKPNTVYALVNDSDKVIVGIKGQESTAPITWKTSNLVDELAPSMEEFPKLKEIAITDKEKNEPAFRFSLQAREVSPLFLLVICQDISRGLFQVQLIRVENNSFELAQNKCMGGFIFEEGRTYTLKLQLTDSSGNVADLSERPIEIKRPEK
jgi:hypothetical protein